MAQPQSRPPEPDLPPPRPEEPITIDAQDARGAEIILKRKRNRAIFIAGLVLFVLLAVVPRMVS